MASGALGCDLLDFAPLGIEALSVVIWNFMSLGCDVLHVFRNFRPRAASVHVSSPHAKTPKSFALVPHGHPRVAAPFCNPTTVTFGGVRDGGFWFVL